MQVKQRLIKAASFVILALAGLTVFVVPALSVAPAFFVAAAQEERLVSSSGQGTLKVGDGKFKLNSVIVKLLPDQKAELTLSSDILIFLTATWSKSAESQNEILLDMRDGDSRGGFEGTGKLILKNEGKTVARLTLKGISRTTKRPVEANFEGK